MSPRISIFSNRVQKNVYSYIKEIIYKKFIGRKIDALMEDKKDAPSDRLRGITSNYIPVYVPWNDTHKNTLVQVRIDGFNRELTVFGTIC